MKRVFISYGATPPMPCPGCNVILRAATGFSFKQSVVPKPGDLTLCDRCLTWCTFERVAFPVPTMTLRLATADEIERVDDDAKALSLRFAEFKMRGDTRH